MLNHDIITKMATDCKHVVLPCMDCVYQGLVKWEARIRQECKMIADDDFRQISERSAKLKAEADRLQEANDRLIMAASRLEKSNAILRANLKEATERVANMNAQLHAAQAVKVPTIRRVESE